MDREDPRRDLAPAVRGRTISVGTRSALRVVAISSAGALPRFDDTIDDGALPIAIRVDHEDRRSEHENRNRGEPRSGRNARPLSTTEVGVRNPRSPLDRDDTYRRPAVEKSRERECSLQLRLRYEARTSHGAGMNVAKPLRVRKEPIEVELLLAGEPPRRVELFLAEHGSRGFDRQSVLDLLEQSEGFLPACDRETGNWESFNSRSVTWIGMSRIATDTDESANELYDRRKMVRVEFAGLRFLEGELLYSAPEESARVVDLMNRGERFLRLWSGDRVYLVNKASVLRVVEATRSGEDSWRR